MKRYLLFLGLFAILTLKSAQAEDNLVQLAAANGQFKTLVNLLVLTGLDKALQSHDELTVFAPTDEAFAKLPAETLNMLRKPSGRETLASILKAHVVPGSRLLGDIKRPADGKPLKTLEGTSFRLLGDGRNPKFGNANVLVANLEASNGIVHVIDEVLMPNPKSENILDTAKAAGKFSTLLAALNAAELSEVFQGNELFTVLAPTDEAFAKIPESTLASLLKPENKSSLQSILKYHVIAGSVLAKDALSVHRAPTLEGGSVNFELKDGRLTVDGATVIKNDIVTSNGIIHVIDTVLMPTSNSGQAAKKPVSLKSKTCAVKTGA